MSLETLLAKLESRAATPATRDQNPGVAAKPAPVLTCTPATPATLKKDNTEGKCESLEKREGQASAIAGVSNEIDAPVRGSPVANIPTDPEVASHAEARRQRVLELLAANQNARYALVTDAEADPEAVILALAICGQATCELRIPKAKYDSFLLLELIERHGGTIH